MLFKSVDPKSIYPSLDSKERGTRMAHCFDSLESADVVLAGYPDDEGIDLNGGRIGAAQAPNEIRKHFYKMTTHPLTQAKPKLFDQGNLKTSTDLATRHQNVSDESLKALSNNKQWIGLGGGHDYGYPDGKAFLDFAKDSKLKPLVINFDAHLDVRPDDKNLNSGTPFYRLLNYGKEQSIDFDFLQIGIQPHCNSSEHYKWCEENGGEIMSWEEIMHSPLSLLELVNKRWSAYLEKRRPTFLSVDIDVFSSSYAMGCSQAWPAGLTPDDFFPCFKSLVERLDVRSLGIYEVSPKLDLDNRTSKLAAQIVYSFLYGRS